jgi:hypothetical protein
VLATTSPHTRPRPSSTDDVYEWLLARLSRASSGQERGESEVCKLPARGATRDLRDARLHFAFRHEPQLDHCLAFRGGAVIFEAGERSDSFTVETTWDAYWAFFSGRDSAELLFMEGDWRFPHGGCGPYDYFETGPYLLAIAELMPAPAPLPADLPARVEDAARRDAPFGPVDRAPAVSRDEFLSEYARRGRPVILEDVRARAAARLTFRRFLELYGDKHALMPLSPTRVYGMPIGPYLERLSKGEAMPLKLSLPLTRAFRGEYQPPDHFAAASFFPQSQKIILAHADGLAVRGYGAATSWHRDWADNFLTQLIGRKRLTVAAPSDAPCFYAERVPARHDNVAWDRSAVDPKNPDLSRHPLFAHARLLDCVLEPGDTLYLPCGWWHNVSNLTPSVAVNGWKIEPLAEVAAAEMH